MTDIVERLRSCLRFDEPNESESELEACTRDAADEIARLQEENEKLSALCDKWNQECDELREDNKRQDIELASLKAQSSEPCGKVIEGYEDRIVHWKDGFMPSVGTLLYRAAPIQKQSSE